MQVAILGPLEVHDDGGASVALAGARLRGLIARLAFPRNPRVLSSLRREGYRLGIFTHATRRAATMTLTGAGLDHFQLTLVGGEEITEPKPAPEGLQLACRRMNVAPAAVAYVGDAEVDLQCAAAAGSLGIHARWGATADATTPHLAAGHPSDVAGLLGSLGDPDL